MARVQTMVQLSDDLLLALDRRADRTGASRSQLIRDAIEQYLRDDVEAELDRQITRGYQRAPQPEDRAAELQLRDYIAAEPW
jgi:metal-responsive CopG/Arc/MetJ family transcriptional regulator